MGFSELFVYIWEISSHPSSRVSYLWKFLSFEARWPLTWYVSAKPGKPSI